MLPPLIQPRRSIADGTSSGASLKGQTSVYVYVIIGASAFVTLNVVVYAVTYQRVSKRHVGTQCNGDVVFATTVRQGIIRSVECSCHCGRTEGGLAVPDKLMPRALAGRPTPTRTRESGSARHSRTRSARPRPSARRARECKPGPYRAPDLVPHSSRSSGLHRSRSNRRMRGRRSRPRALLSPCRPATKRPPAVGAPVLPSWPPTTATGQRPGAPSVPRSMSRPQAFPGGPGRATSPATRAGSARMAHRVRRPGLP